MPPPRSTKKPRQPVRRLARVRACGVVFPVVGLLALLFVAIASNVVAQVPVRLFIREYRVEGASTLPRVAIEEAVYPFLGPSRTGADVEQARASLEQAFHDKGFQTVAVVIPEQDPAKGIIRLQVVERTVGRLRVKGARYSSPREIKAMAPSLAEGGVIDFNGVTKEIVGLNQLPDRRVTPSLRAGASPDTVDVDLEVKESRPVHAGVEVNNRHGADTTALRVSGSVSANNLWQKGHGAGFSFQTSPQKTSEVKVFSGYYLTRFRGADGLTLMVQGAKQDSKVSTLGDVAVAGRGETLGASALFSLPSSADFSHSASVGLNYKHYDDNVRVGATSAGETTPIAYYPLETTYSAAWFGKNSSTEFKAGLNFNLRGVGGKSEQFGNSRFKADASYLVFHGELSHTHKLPAGFEVFGKVQGQVADQPLINHEQGSGGGLGTVRGYLEAETVGDNTAFGSLEVRSPTLWHSFVAKRGEWRVFAFYEGGVLTLRDPLPEQTARFRLSSYGLGTSLRLLDSFSGSVQAAVPQTDQSKTKAGAVRVTFRAALDF